MSKQTPAGKPAFGPLSADGRDQVIFATVDAAVSTAAQAQWVFQDQSLEMRRAVIKAMRKTSIANAERWGRMAVEETKMGRVEDKAQKNLLCATRSSGPNSSCRSCPSPPRGTWTLPSSWPIAPRHATIILPPCTRPTSGI